MLPLVRENDAALGVIWRDSTSPANINNSFQPIIWVDQTLLPDGSAFPNPCNFKWRIISTDTSNLELSFRLSSNEVSYELQDDFITQIQTDSTGEFQRCINLPPILRYATVFGRVYPEDSGQCEILLGIEDFTE